MDGTPTDCVIMAVNELLGYTPDFCLSGVNHGANMGEDVLYSGTVAAAMEATVIGIPAVALSYYGRTMTTKAWTRGARSWRASSARSWPGKPFPHTRC